jgi:uncharacterized repeat protein (TIGR03837 family)
MHWDLFCRVVDNFGDIGVCWRLAADLGARGLAVRLWVDDASALSWMAPRGAPQVAVLPWKQADGAAPGAVVIEAFGCDPPPAFVARMTRRSPPPLWINLEYLSAEAYVRRSHGLRSPQLAGPGKGLDKWFFYPGFESGTGGLIREAKLMEEREHFGGHAWLQARGWAPRDGERVLSLFCYQGAPLPALLQSLADRPTLLLLTPGAATQAAAPAAPPLRCIALPWLTQPDYDRLLWACDLNFVRGEDSFVRALWAGAPFVWQAYPQHDAAHAAKLDAYLDLMLREHAAPAARVRALWLAWNGLGPWPAALPPMETWQALTRRWREHLQLQPDLVTQLLRFVAAKQ